MAEPVTLARHHMAGQHDMHGARLAGQEQGFTVGKTEHLAETVQPLDLLRRQRRKRLRIAGVGLGRDGDFGGGFCQRLHPPGRRATYAHSEFATMRLLPNLARSCDFRMTARIFRAGHWHANPIG